MKISIWIIAASFVLSAGAASAAGDLASGSKVTFDFKGLSLAEAADRLAQLTGNKPFVVDEDLQEKPVTLAVKDANYWEAVDKVCDALGILYIRGFAQGANGPEGCLRLTAAEQDSRLTGYAGPAAVKVDSVSRVVPLYGSRAFPLGIGPAVPEGFTVNLTYYWEDRLDPLTEEIELTKAVTPKGDSLLSAAREDRLRSGSPAIQVPTGGVKQPPCRSASFKLAAPKVEAATLSELSGVVRLIFAEGDRDVTVEDLLHAKGRELKADDWTVKIVNVDLKKGDREFEGRYIGDLLFVTVELSCKGQAATAPPASWTVGKYGFYAQVGEGGPKAHGTFRAAAPAGPQPSAPRNGVGTSLMPAAGQNAPKPGQSSIIIAGDFRAGDLRLVLTVPGKVDAKEFPFTIKDIPIP